MTETIPFTETRRFRVMRAIVGTVNPLLRTVLASPIGRGLNRALLLLEFRGRRSGRVYRTPVGFVRDGNRIVVVTSPTYRWWRNVVDGADVRVRLGGAWHAARAELITPDDPRYDEVLALQVRLRGPQMLRAFGVPVTDDGRLPDESRGAAANAHLVLIELEAPETAKAA
jgi:deazaflavin-dependent oxidoreductase (nitroreductase family)